MMKRCVVMLLVCALAVTSQAGLISNGGFETGDLTGWTAETYSTSQSITVQSDAAYVYEGTYSAALWANDTTSSWLEIYQNIACTEGMEFTVSMYYLEEAGNWAGMGVNITYYDADWNYLDYEWVEVLSTSTEGTGSWLEFSQDYTAVTDAAYAEISIVMGNWGTVYVDAVSVVPEPATLLLLGAGAVLSACRKRR